MVDKGSRALPHTMWTVVRTGALIGIALTFAYALVFAVYAILRSLPLIVGQTPQEIGIWATMAANSASILVACLSFAALLSVTTAPVGTATALVIAWINDRWNPLRQSRRAVWIGAAVSSAVVLLLHAALQGVLSAAGRALPSLGLETYLFWFGLPGLFMICAAAFGAWRLNGDSSARHTDSSSATSTAMRSRFHAKRSLTMKSSVAQYFARSRRGLLIALDAFLAITAAAGGIGLLGGGVAPPLEMLDGSPFRDFMIPGWALLMLVGGSALIATGLMIYRHRWGAHASAVAGTMIMGFEIVEVMVIGSPLGLARNLQIFYFALGLCLVALAASIWEAEHPVDDKTIGHSPA